MGNLCTANRTEGDASTEISVAIIDKEQQINAFNKKTDIEDKSQRVSFIQSEWRKKKEKEKMVEKIIVLENTISSLGKYISVETMKNQTSPGILKVQRSLNTFKGSREDERLLEEKLIFRRPFQFNYDKSIYHGFWSSFGLREGFGIYVREDGSLQEGLWRDSKIYKGRLFNQDGSYFEGDIQDGGPHGMGKKVLANGSVQSGQWRKAKQVLIGERSFCDGYKYIGNFSNDLFSGKGKFFFPDKSVYDGDFIKSSFNGSGRFSTPDGHSYQGRWLNNLASGKGCYIYSKDMFYEGDYRNGEKDGNGKLTIDKDSHYIGEWKHGLPHGNGEYKAKSIVHKGLWRYGRLIHNDNTTLAIKNQNDVISLKVEKEKFKNGNELLHLLENGQIKDNALKQSKSYRASQGADILNKIALQLETV